MTGYRSDSTAIALAREIVYRFCAAMLRHPGEGVGDIRSEANLVALEAATEILRDHVGDDAVPLGFGELPAEELNPKGLIEWLRRPPDDLFVEYDRVFGIGPTVDCPPYETEFAANQEPFYRAQQMADVAGFYQAFGLQISRRRPERPDHISVELEFMGLLVTKERFAAAEQNPQSQEQAAICNQAQRDFLRDHLSWWIPSYATGLRNKAVDGPYAALGRLLSALMPVERSLFDLKAPQAPVRPRSVERPEEETGCEGCSSPTAE